MILCDPAAERAVLSGIMQYGDKVYLEVSDILQESTFTVDSNQYLYQCLRHICEHNTLSSIDLASVFSVAQELGLSHLVNTKSESQHIKAIKDFPVDQNNIRKFAGKIKKLEIARDLHQQLKNTQDKLLDITGNESITSILGIAEDSVFDFSSKLNDSETGPEIIGSNLAEYIDYLESHPVEQIGISTGFPVFDKAIGGGLRKNTINVIAARPKTGKTLLSDNMGYYIANTLRIPVLNMDTEMTKEDHIHRLLAMSTEIEIQKIETGKFADSPNLKKKLRDSADNISKIPLYHKSIAGKSFEEQLAIMRRWIVKEVGLKADGTAKECVIFYDYLKLMDSAGISQDMKEYQVLGFMMTSLHNFACKYGIPIVAFIQLNRDGITKESTDTASGSDRIIWLCSNFSIFKRKTDEEIAEDGPDNGNRKLVPLISRHGGGLDDNDYINCHMKGWCAKITEGRTRLEITSGIGGNNDGFIINENNDENQKIEFV